MLATIIALLFSVSGIAKEVKIPPDLMPWKDWVLHGRESAICPTPYNNSGEHYCAWPGQLYIDAEENGGTFRQSWKVSAYDAVMLPGNETLWPVNVKVNGKPASPVPVDGKPALRLEAGEWEISGSLMWKEMPVNMAVPALSGLVELKVARKKIEAPLVDQNGELWLRQGTEKQDKKDVAIENRMEVQIFRLVQDSSPMEVSTVLRISVSGMARREKLKDGCLPADSTAVSASSQIPLRITEDGGIWIEARPGKWDITVNSVFRLPKGEMEKIDCPYGSEVWAFQPFPHLRSVRIEGVSAVDPSQTMIPSGWKSFSAYVVKQDDSVKFTELRRGTAATEPGSLNLYRDLWLDFDGKGAVVKDRITGSLTRRHYLGLDPEVYRLGRVTLGGSDQMVTLLVRMPGIEIENGSVDLTAVSRMNRLESGTILPVGWGLRFQNAEGSLHLPPGWKLLAFGGGTVPGNDTWVDRWTLLDFFLVLITCVSVTKIWNIRWGIACLAGLCITFHEPYAPKFLWIGLAALAAMLEYLKKNPDIAGGFFTKTLKAANVLTLVSLAGMALMFTYMQIRTAIYPQLDSPVNPFIPMQTMAVGALAPAPAPQALAKQKAMMDTVARGPAESPATPVESDKEQTLEMLNSLELPAKGSMPRREKSSLYAGNAEPKADMMMNYELQIDKKQAVQTGPGLPEWRWKTIPVKYGLASGTHKMALWLLSPTENALLSFLRVALVLLLAFRFGSAGIGKTFKSGSKYLPKIACIAAAFLVFCHAAPTFAASFPSPEMLTELEKRLLEPDQCFPDCAAIPHMKISVPKDGKTVSITMLVDAAKQSAIPLPSSLGTWATLSVKSASGENIKVLSHEGGKWILVPQGQSAITIEAAAGFSPQIRMSFPLPPGFIDTETPGWVVTGLNEHSQAPTELIVAKPEGAGKKTGNDDFFSESSTLTGYLKITRRIILGLDWRVITTAERIQKQDGPKSIIMEIPLFAGELVESREVKVKGNMVKVELGAGENQVSWNSAIPVANAITMKMPENPLWSEAWHVKASGAWHFTSSGVPQVHHDGQPGTFWYPQPGQELKIDISHIEAAPGEFTTIDSTRTDFYGGDDLSRLLLSASVRTTKGGFLPVKSPPGWTFKSLKSAGMEIPANETDGIVNVPLQPGARKLEIEWFQQNTKDEAFLTKAFMPRLYRIPTIDLSMPSTNAEMYTHLPQGLWLLASGGPRLGPAILFWGYFLTVIVVAALFGRFSKTPLRIMDWVLLGIGIAPLGPGYVIVTVIWFLSVQTRSTHAPERPLYFNLSQIALVILTLAMFEVIYSTVVSGLLGTPDMYVTGNGSHQTLLHWTMDRAESQLPSPWAFSFPVYVFRLLMFLWALWFALRIAGWSRWAVAAFRNGGVWKKKTKTA